MKRPEGVLLAVLVAALALRLGAALAWDRPLTGDELDYDRLGVSIAAGDGLVDGRGRPSAFRPPAYPALVGAVYALAGPRPVLVRVLQALVGTATVLLVFVLGRAAAGRGAGLVAAGIVAVDFAQVAATARLLSETTFTAVLVGLVLASVRAVDALRSGREAWRPAALAGALGGLGALLRGILLPYPILLAAGIAWAERRRPAAAWRAIAAVALGWVLVLAPWTLRNARALDAFVPVTTQVGITFYSSQNPPEGRIFGVLSRDATTASVAGLPETERSRVLLRAGLDSLRADPLGSARLEALKLLFFVVPFDWEVLPWYGALNPTYAFVAIWCLVALVIVVRRGRAREALARWPLWLPIAFFLAMALVFYGSPRLRLPVEPLAAVAAAWGLTRVAASGGRGRAVALALATFVPLLGVFAFGEQAKALVRALARAVGLWS